MLITNGHKSASLRSGTSKRMEESRKLFQDGAGAGDHKSARGTGMFKRVQVPPGHWAACLKAVHKNVSITTGRNLHQHSITAKSAASRKHFQRGLVARKSFGFRWFRNTRVVPTSCVFLAAKGKPSCVVMSHQRAHWNFSVGTLVWNGCPVKDGWTHACRFFMPGNCLKQGLRHTA